MKTVFIVISSILAIVNVLPYIRDVYKKKTKPRIVSWFNWSLLNAIASAASFSDHQYASAILTLLVSIETLVVVTLAFHYGDRDIGPFDMICQIGAIVGLILWLAFNSPSIAIIATVTIDIIATTPTLRHSWQKPNEETGITFVLGSVAAIFALLAAQGHKVTAIVFPIYLVLINILISMIIYLRSRSTIKA